MGKIFVGGEEYEKWHLKPLGVEKGDRVRISFKSPGATSLTERDATVLNAPDETVARLDMDRGTTWILRHGAVLILVEGGPQDRYHGTLITIEQIDE